MPHTPPTCRARPIDGQIDDSKTLFVSPPTNALSAIEISTDYESGRDHCWSRGYRAHRRAARKTIVRYRAMSSSVYFHASPLIQYFGRQPRLLAASADTPLARAQA